MREKIKIVWKIIELLHNKANINISLKQILHHTYTISFSMEYNNFVLIIQYCINVMCRLQILNMTLNKKFCKNWETEKKKKRYNKICKKMYFINYKNSFLIVEKTVKYFKKI